MDKKGFLFYYNWEEQIDLMSNTELRRFIKNLIRYDKGEKVELPTKAEKLTWLGIVKALEINQYRFKKSMEARQKNAKLGGAPIGNQNARKSKTTENNLNNQITNKREKTTGKSKEKKEKGEKETGNKEQEQEKRELTTDITSTNTSTYTGKYTGNCLLEQEIDEINHFINTRHYDAQPGGKDSLFKGYVEGKLQEKILATGYFKSSFFEYLKPVNFSDVERKLTPEVYESVKPFLLEYMKLKFNYTF